MSLIVPDGVIRPILLIGPLVVAVTSVNHRLPSGPTVMAPGLLPAIGSVNMRTVPLIAETDGGDGFPIGTVPHPTDRPARVRSNTNMWEVQKGERRIGRLRVMAVPLS